MKKELIIFSKDILGIIGGFSLGYGLPINGESNLYLILIGIVLLLISYISLRYHINNY